MARRPTFRKPAVTKERATAAAASAIVAGGIAAVSTTPSPAAVALAAVPPFASLVLGAVFTAVSDWRVNNLQGWWEHLTRGEDEGGPSGPDFERLFEERATDPAVRENVLRSVKAVVDTVDEAALKPLARLSREYLVDRRSPDAFFRGTARMLAELSATELGDLLVLADLSVASLDAHEAELGDIGADDDVEMELVLGQGANTMALEIRIGVLGPNDRIGSRSTRSFAHVAAPPSTLALMGALDAERLALMRPRPSPALDVRRSVLRRLRRLLA